MQFSERKKIMFLGHSFRAKCHMRITVGDTLYLKFREKTDTSFVLLGPHSKNCSLVFWKGTLVKPIVRLLEGQIGSYHSNEPYASVQSLLW